MPLTEKGSEILSNMEREYGEAKGKSVFYASRNAGTVAGVDAVLDSIAEGCDRLDRRIGALEGKGK